MIELNKRYSLVTSPGMITLEGATLIEQLIRAQRVVNTDEWKNLNPDYPHWWLPELPDHWEWIWVITKGENQGTFPRRVARYYFKEYGLKCPKGFLTEIGNIARAHSQERNSESFDFDNQFGWDDGDFGDGGSCYWWNGEAGLEALRNNGFKAIRFYMSDDSNIGIARAWLYEMDSDLFIIFNGYGYSALTIAGIFARFSNLRYKKIELTNFDSTTGVLYINNESGYIIGERDVIERYNYYDFEIDCEEFDICESCGRHMHEDNVYYSPYGEPYCEDCFDRYFRNCDMCGNTFANDAMTYIENDGFEVCDRCLERHYSYCDGCEEYRRGETMYEHEGEMFCWQCLNERTNPPDYAE